MAPSRLVGYVVQFGDVCYPRDCHSEFVAYGAFSASIRRGGLELCIDHDRRRGVARQQDGTLSVREDHLGLWIEADLQSGEGRALLSYCRDIPFGASFMFCPSRSRIELAQPPRRARILREAYVLELTLDTRGWAAYRNSWLMQDSVRARDRARGEQFEALRDASI